MRVILLQDIKSLGRKNDVKDVNDGYARNFLIPKKLAAPLTAEAREQKKQLEEKKQKLITKLKETAKKIANETLVFPVKTGEKNEVFGSVTKDDIKKALEKKGYETQRIVLAHPLKALGEYLVEVDFGRGIRAKVKITLQAE